MNLILHLKSKYFEKVKAGEKQLEFRKTSPYWEKQIPFHRYDRVLIWDAFKKAGPETVLVFPWRGYYRTTITHDHFGPRPVEVFAIKLERQRRDRHNGQKQRTK